jgi:hypothetical protein
LAKDEHREAPDFDETGESSHAADEPTAVWDMEALRKAGLGDLANLPEGPDAAPATPAEGMAQQRPSMIVDEKTGAPVNATGPNKPSAADPLVAQKEQASGGWWGLIAMAALLAAAAYLAIRLLR